MLSRFLVNCQSFSFCTRIPRRGFHQWLRYCSGLIMEHTALGIELPSGILYLSIHDAEVSKQRKLELPVEFCEGNKGFYTISTSKPSKARADIAHDLLQNKLLQTEFEDIPSCRLFNSFRYSRDEKEEFQRSFTLCYDKTADVKPWLLKIAKKHKECTMATLEVSGSSVVQTVFDVATEDVLEQNQLCRVEGPEYHPCYRTEEHNSIFHDFQRAKEIMSCVDKPPAAKEVLEIISKTVSDPLTDAKKSRKFPFIVVEGLDATGKSTLTNRLKEMMNASIMHTPPDNIRELRRSFDNLPQMIRRSYYSLGNYSVAAEVAVACQHQPVIMDRFWFSTAAYAMATDCGIGDASALPPLGHPVYDWPEDLIKPSAIIFLTVSEEIRQQRMKHRNEALTDEEKKLGDEKNLFRQRLLEAYKRFVHHSAITIDASLSVDEVAEETKSSLKQLGLISES